MKASACDVGEQCREKYTMQTWRWISNVEQMISMLACSDGVTDMSTTPELLTSLVDHTQIALKQMSERHGMERKRRVKRPVICVSLLHILYKRKRRKLYPEPPNLTRGRLKRKDWHNTNDVVVNSRRHNFYANRIQYLCCHFVAIVGRHSAPHHIVVNCNCLCHDVS